MLLNKSRLKLLFSVLMLFSVMTVFAEAPQAERKELKTEKTGFKWYSVRKGDLFGAENGEGKRLIEPVYDLVAYINNTNFFLAISNGKSCAYDTLGTCLIGPDKEFDDIVKIDNEGYIWFKVRKGKRTGACNEKGEEILPLKYKDLIYSNGEFKYKDGEEWTRIELDQPQSEIISEQENLASEKKNAVESVNAGEKPSMATVEERSIRGGKDEKKDSRTMNPPRSSENIKRLVAEEKKGKNKESRQPMERKSVSGSHQPITFATGDIEYYNTWTFSPASGGFWLAGEGADGNSKIFHIEEDNVTVNAKGRNSNERVFDYDRTDRDGNRLYQYLRKIPSLNLTYEIIISADGSCLNFVTYGENNVIEVENYVVDPELRDKIIDANRGSVKIKDFSLIESSIYTPDVDPSSGIKYSEWY